LPTNFDLFGRAERIEIVAAAIYGALAKRFREDADAEELFTRLEAEELQHANRIRLLASAYRTDPKLLAKVSGGDELDTCLTEAEDALHEVQTGGWGPGLDDVKQRLGLLEVRLAKAHANMLALNGNGVLRDFFERLALMDDAHARLLLDADG